MGTVEGIDRPTKTARKLRNRATPAERMLWRRLNGRKLGVRFNRQMPVGPFVCDFMCRSEMLIVELDGHSHDVRTEADDLRQRFIESRGFRVLRFSNAEVLGNVDGVIEGIAFALKKGPPPAPPASGRGEDT
ncbi:endonuclease domain-containing protein [Stakelama tenebrarum]|uniref:DUF559 domain-containing protein n=1 Tax=Stakelama tenebrarum TaxID=2711215 RepID=A0A6G6Y6E7_9SPHN|nr:DUF559 domain-containing protein [Sphingosinithalassobacter tenebrarum]QIG80479.1 DUF559 domain-containing protein [Sphingosinithalassobacter tenebrarum]